MNAHTLTRPQLPESIEDVNAELITGMLDVNYPGVVVESVYIGDVIWGTAAKMRLLLSYNAAGHRARLPATMILKAGIVSESIRDLIGTCYANEVRFFRDWAPQLDFVLPGIFFCGVDGTRQGALLMEDLTARNVTFGRAPVPIAAEVAPIALGQLARLHAKWWRKPELDVLDTYPSVLGGVADEFFTADHWNAILELPRSRFVPDALRDRLRLQAGIRRLFSLEANLPEFMLHGDPHPGNMFFSADGDPSFLDWQGVQRGPWAHDVSYFIIGSLSVEDRRTHERDLLQHYLAQLAAHGGPTIGFEEAWLRYRQHAMYEFINVLTPTIYQPESVGEAHAERSCAALLDLDALGALGV